MHGCKSHYSFMFFMHAPLLQFELLEKAPSCDFDLLFPFIGLNEYDNASMWLLGVVVL